MTPGATAWPPPSRGAGSGAPGAFWSCSRAAVRARRRRESYLATTWVMGALTCRPRRFASVGVRRPSEPPRGRVAAGGAAWRARGPKGCPQRPAWSRWGLQLPTTVRTRPRPDRPEPPGRGGAISLKNSGRPKSLSRHPSSRDSWGGIGAWRKLRRQLLVALTLVSTLQGALPKSWQQLPPRARRQRLARRAGPSRATPIWAAT